MKFPGLSNMSLLTNALNVKWLKCCNYNIQEDNSSDNVIFKKNLHVSKILLWKHRDENNNLTNSVSMWLFKIKFELLYKLKWNRFLITNMLSFYQDLIFETTQQLIFPVSIYRPIKRCEQKSAHLKTHKKKLVWN